MSLIRNISDTECLRTKRRRTKCGVKGLWYKTSPHKVLLRKCRGKCRWNKMSPIQTILAQNVSAQNVFKVSETKRLRKNRYLKMFCKEHRSTKCLYKFGIHINCTDCYWMRPYAKLCSDESQTRNSHIKIQVIPSLWRQNLNQHEGRFNFGGKC